MFIDRAGVLASNTRVKRCGGVDASKNLIAGRFIVWVLAPFMEDEESAKRDEGKAKQMIPHQRLFKVKY